MAAVKSRSKFYSKTFQLFDNDKKIEIDFEEQQGIFKLGKFFKYSQHIQISNNQNVLYLFDKPSEIIFNRINKI